MERKDRLAALLHFASLTTGSFGLIFMALGLKTMKDKWSLFASIQDIDSSINKTRWIEGEVVSDESFKVRSIKPKSIPDHSSVVHSTYKKTVSFNFVGSREEEFREKVTKSQSRNFKILSGDKAVTVFNNNVKDCEVIFEDIEPVQKGLFGWIKSIASILFVFTYPNPPVIQDHLVRITESVISLHQIYQVFGLLKRVKGEYFIEPSIITNKKDLFLAKEVLKISAIMTLSFCCLLLSHFFYRLRKNILSREKSVTAPKTMECLVCSQARVSIFYRPCNHFCICTDCHQNFDRPNSDLCPMCSFPYEGFQVVNN